MANPESSPIISDSADYDVVIVGASLAGCTTAIALGRAGARVALVEKSPDPQSFKRICGHFIQASAVPTLERLELLDRMLEAGGVRSRMRARTPWGWIDPPAEQAGYAVNLRREVLDPLVRRAAAEAPGVEMMLGHTAQSLIEEDGAFCGVVVEDQAGWQTELRGRFVVGADGRNSRLAAMARVPSKSFPHGRFAYGAYYEGAPPPDSPNAMVWMMDPQWGAAFPTDDGLTLYSAMPTKDRLPEFKQDPAKALRSFVADLPEPPPIMRGRQVGPVFGKVDMTNIMRAPSVPGLALVGDAALATDPLYGVGCGWAFQSAEWLAESVAPALQGAEPLKHGLVRYSRRHKRELRGHASLIHDYATGRRLQPPERLLFAAAVRDQKVATIFDEFGTRRIRPARMLATAMPRALAVNARYSLGRRRANATASGEAVAI